MTSIQSNARCWKNLLRRSRSPLTFSCHSKMLPCPTASEQGESVILQVSQVPQLLASQAQKWPSVTPADTPSWRKDEMYHFYLLLRSLLPSSKDTGVVTWHCFKEPNYCCWACQPPQCAGARHSVLPAAFLAGTLVSSVPTVQQKLRPDLGWASGVSYWLWGLGLPSFSWLPPSLQILIYKIRRTKSYHWRLLGGSVEMAHRCRIGPLLTLTSAIIRVTFMS